ncbi:unnamed protein product [Gongylonema pulchrum]|uniref:TAXi_C domain-containing protein n=1 Tax=Gongylonema pulchrum TaxID=637853 RepID=A0A183EGX3_9BILA|nr:unnamed protein product [Gongylonema pulchrum]
MSTGVLMKLQNSIDEGDECIIIGGVKLKFALNFMVVGDQAVQRKTVPAHTHYCLGCDWKDKSLFKVALKAGSASDIESTSLQQRLLILTQNFMMPLENYVSSLMPLKKYLSPFKNLPPICPFVAHNFFVALDETRLMQTSGIRGDWRGNCYSLLCILVFMRFLQQCSAKNAY